MGSPEKPLDVEMGDMDEQSKLNPPTEIKGAGKEDAEEERFTGLKKEELLEISSQKKWVVARWILFILFWAAWVGMLVGAIIIVVKAPRCKPEPTPPWYQDTVVYQANAKKFAGDLAGMTEHIDYIRSLKSKTLTVCHVTDPQDLAKVDGGDSGEQNFAALVNAAHHDDKDKNLMVVVELRIDALSTMSAKFAESATSGCASASPTGEACSMFFWQPNSTLAELQGNWAYHAVRQENYKVTEGDEAMAYVNYDDESALEYIKSVIKAWIASNNKTDGFQLRDMSMVENREKVIKAIQTAINETQTPLEEDKRKVIGLFLASGSTSNQSSMYSKDDDADSAAVVINTALTESTTAMDIKAAIEKWRDDTKISNESRFIGAYAVNTMDLAPLAERLGKKKAAGLTLFSYSLPGVPVVRSGDEALLEDDEFTWNAKEENEIQKPNNASDTYTEMLAEVTDLRVNQHRALRSLRWDNQDSTFEFRDTNDTNVVAIWRKWDIKPAVLAIYNPSGNDLIVKVTSKGKEDSLQVLGASDPDIQKLEDPLKFDSISMKSGSAILCEVKEEK